METEDDTSVTHNECRETEDKECSPVSNDEQDDEMNQESGSSVECNRSWVDVVRNAARSHSGDLACANKASK